MRAALDDAQADGDGAPRGPDDDWDQLSDAMRAFHLPEVASTGTLDCTDVQREVVRDKAATLAMAELLPPPSDPSRPRRARDAMPPRPDQEEIHGSELRLLWTTRHADVGCWFSATGPAEARCATREVDSSRGLIDSDDGLRDLFVSTSRELPGGRGRPYDGMQITRLVSGVAPSPLPHPMWGADWAHASGAVTALAPELDEIVVLTPDAAPIRAALPSGQARWYRVAPHWALGSGLKDRGTNQGGMHQNVFVLPIDETGRPAGAVQHLGKLDGWFRLHGCRRADGATTLVWVETEGSSAEIQVAYPRGPAELSPLVSSRVHVPSRSDLRDEWTEDMSCGERGDPRWAFVDSDGVLHEVSCTPAGCKHDESVGGQRRFAPGTVVSIGDDEILEVGVYSLTYPPGTPTRSILGARRAKLHDLGDAPLRVLLEEPAMGKVGHAQPAPGSPDAREAFGPSWLGFRPHSRGEVGWITGTIGGELIAIRLRPGQPAELVRRIEVGQ